jgi:hypothetical protein
MSTEAETDLTDAAVQLGVTRAKAYDMVLTGQLIGERRAGRWFVTRASVEAARERVTKTRTTMVRTDARPAAIPGRPTPNPAITGQVHTREVPR